MKVIKLFLFALTLCAQIPKPGGNSLAGVPASGGVGGASSLVTAAQVVCVDAAGTAEECNANASPAITKAIAAVSTDGLLLANTTAATAGAQKWSPRMHWSGRGWKTDATAASQAVDWIAELVPVQGAANPQARLDFSYSVNGGAYATTMSLLNGNVGIGTSEPNSILSGNGKIAIVGGNLSMLTLGDKIEMHNVRRWINIGGATTNWVISQHASDATHTQWVSDPDDTTTDAVTVLMQLQTNGSLGIGTTIPLHKNTTVGGSIAVYGSYTATDYYGLTGTSADGTFTFAATTLGTGADDQSIVFTPAGAGIVSTGGTFKAGGYQSSDGTAGATGTCTGSPTVKNGLVVSCAGI